jgi:hypothetical protein
MAERVVERTETEAPRETVVVDRDRPREGLSPGAVVAIIIVALILLFLIFGRGLFGGSGGGGGASVSAPTTSGQ